MPELPTPSSSWVFDQDSVWEAGASPRRQRVVKEARPCVACGELFTGRSDRQTCSERCLKRRAGACRFCGGAFEGGPKKQFCSTGCAWRHRQGEERRAS